MKISFLMLLLICGISRAEIEPSRSIVIVVGASGEPEYAEQFSKMAAEWQEAATKGGLRTTLIGLATNAAVEDRTQLLTTLTNETAILGGELWLVLIGHGTFDGKTANFNLRGPDISASELADALKPCHRPMAIINCASASGPFLTALSASNRVVITATRSGYEVNTTRFGIYLARAIASPAADLDKDGQTSLLEAYLTAARETESFFKDEGRVLTEHALMDDNGDGLGTPADWFHGTRAVKTATGGKSVDGIRAHQMFLVPGPAERDLTPEARAKRDDLEQKLSALRLQKGKLAEEDYYRQLEAIMVETARLYETK